jgi:hypothetical protein
MFNLELAGHNRTKQSKEEKNKTTPHNTDNMGKLFVTFFAFATATQTGSYDMTNPDRSTAPNKLNCTWIVD